MLVRRHPPHMQAWRSLQAHFLNKHNWRCRLVDGKVAVFDRYNNCTPLGEVVSRLVNDTQTQRNGVKAESESAVATPGILSGTRGFIKETCRPYHTLTEAGEVDVVENYTTRRPYKREMSVLTPLLYIKTTIVGMIKMRALFQLCHSGCYCQLFFNSFSNQKGQPVGAIQGRAMPHLGSRPWA